jgi:hypothetical protein
VRTGGTKTSDTALAIFCSRKLLLHGWFCIAVLWRCRFQAALSQVFSYSLSTTRYLFRVLYFVFYFIFFFVFLFFCFFVFFFFCFFVFLFFCFFLGYLIFWVRQIAEQTMNGVHFSCKHVTVQKLLNSFFSVIFYAYVIHEDLCAKQILKLTCKNKKQKNNKQ